MGGSAGVAPADGLAGPRSSPSSPRPAGPCRLVRRTTSCSRARSRGPRAVLRLPPATNLVHVATAAALARQRPRPVPDGGAWPPPSRTRLRRAGVAVAAHPSGWALGAAGATVVGTRAAAWAPVADLAAVVVLDEHDEAHQQEQAPTWHARDVAIERARRAGRALRPDEPLPDPGGAGVGRPARGGPHPRPGRVAAGRGRRPAGRGPAPRPGCSRRPWSACSDPTAGCCACSTAPAGPGCSPAPPAVSWPGARAARPPSSSPRRRCTARGAATTDRRSACSAAAPGSRTPGPGSRGCGRSWRRWSASRSPSSPPSPSADTPLSRVVVGTEAVLQRIDRADAVAFLDLDQELLAPRYRAAEQALALVARAARVVAASGPASGRAAGHLLLQTRSPDHEVVRAVVNADVQPVAEAERARRELLRFPPYSAMAEVSGAAAPAFVERPRPPGRRRGGGGRRRPLVGASGRPRRPLRRAGARWTRPAGRLRIEVDPLRI